MKIHQYREMMRYLTRKPAPKISTQVASGEERVTEPDIYEDKKFNMGDPGMVIDPLKITPKNFTDDMPFAPQQNVPGQQLKLKTGGRVNLKDGTKEPPKIIPLDLESVAFKLFQDKLDNLSYNQKQTVYDYIEDNRNKKADGGRIKLRNGTEEPYNPEIPSLGFSDPIDILEQQLINEKDPTKINALDFLLEKAKKERTAKEIEREQFKKSQKEKGIKYKEDFPSEAAYFAETGKQLLTNPKYTLGSLGKGAVKGTEFLIGQPLQTLFSQEGKNWEFYKPVLTEKLGIDKFVEENIPKGATTGTLFGGETLETVGEFADPFLVYGLAKGAIKGAKPKPPAAAADETIDPTRRDILKTGAVMGTGALLYPTAKKIGMFEELTKGTKVAARTLPKVAGMPEWFPSLISKIEKEGVDVIGKEGVKDLVNTKKLEIPVAGKKESETIFMTKYPDGTIEINANMKGGAYDEPFELYYKPPKTRVDEKTGKVIEEAGEFSVVEQRPRPVGGPEDADYEFDWELVSKDDAISDLEKIEKTATGKIKDSKIAEKRTARREGYYKSPYDDITDRYGDPGDIEYDRMRDAGLFDEIE